MPLNVCNALLATFEGMHSSTLKGSALWGDAVNLGGPLVLLLPTRAAFGISPEKDVFNFVGSEIRGPPGSLRMLAALWEELLDVLAQPTLAMATSGRLSPFPDLACQETGPGRVWESQELAENSGEAMARKPQEPPFPGMWAKLPHTMLSASSQDGWLPSQGGAGPRCIGSPPCQFPGGWHCRPGGGGTPEAQDPGVRRGEAGPGLRAAAAAAKVWPERGQRVPHPSGRPPEPEQLGHAAWGALRAGPAGREAGGRPGAMGSGGCSRRHKGLVQTGFLLTAALGLLGGLLLYGHLEQKARAAQALAATYRGQQEALSAQLQVVYEHRSRLERSLQKERGEHKKTKEDFLVYKLEAQEVLNKEKQDSMNRYGALSSQHRILKNQHEDVKKQLLDLQLQHSGLRLEHRKALESHGQRYAQLQREKDSQVASLQDTVYKLREESKLLRKAHQDIHTQLRNAQSQMEEFRQLKEALQKMPSFQEPRASRQQQQQVVLQAPRQQAQLRKPQVFVATGSRVALNPQEPELAPRWNPQVALPPATRALPPAGPPFSDLKLPSSGPPAWPQKPIEGHVLRFTRTVNSLPVRPPIQQVVVVAAPVSTSPERPRPRGRPPQQQPLTGLEREPQALPAPGSPQVQMQSWQDIVNRVNAQEKSQQYPPSSQPLGQGQPLPPTNPGEGAGHPAPTKKAPRRAAPDEEELEMDAGMIEREENMRLRKEPEAQGPVGPDTLADPAHDPNNQGEDEFEEAEVEQPRLEEGAPRPQQAQEAQEQGAEEQGQVMEEAGAGPHRTGTELLNDYRDDQELDENPDLELVPETKSHPEAPGQKDNYY
ncbi:Golgi integral membrane protein 4-like [Petaurus breviceps papuanus]|uniref:Golgi integral membrane protein 4-like n=1 Tax=Petaurus breviceps papuanus TaxID=3040969 RepID=UPI0036DE404B